MNNSKFKIGDKVITALGHIGTIINIKDNKYEVFFKTDSALIHPKRLKLYNNVEKAKYKIGDKVIFNSQVFIVTNVGYRSLGHIYFIKGYDKGNNTCKVITEKFLKPYNK